MGTISRRHFIGVSAAAAGLSGGRVGAVGGEGQPADPHIDALLISMTSSARIDEYVVASAAPQLRGENLQLLARYACLQCVRYCHHGCDVCERACPEGVEIAEVLRTRMYEVDYGDRELALRDHAQLGTDASACLSCSHQACLGACPYDLSIPSFTRDAAVRLG